MAIVLRRRSVKHQRSDNARELSYAPFDRRTDKGTEISLWRVSYHRECVCMDTLHSKTVHGVNMNDRSLART